MEQLSIKKVTEQSTRDYSGESPVTTINEITYKVNMGEISVGEARVTSNGFSISAWGMTAQNTEEVDAILSKMFEALNV